MANGYMEEAVPVVNVCGNGGNNGGMFGGDGWWAIILFALIFGWGGNRGGFGGGDGSGASANYVLASDFATIQRQLSDGFGGVEKGLDTIRNGLCDGFYTQAQLVNGVNTNILQGTNTLASQLANCCCEIREGIQANTTQSVMNTNAIQNQIASCCCENEKMIMQSRFDAERMNCGTLQAIDKLGDRILGYMADEKMNTLRDENAALKLAASQAAQNNYLINQLRPYPVPAYPSCNPFAASYGWGNSNSCGCGCGCNG